MKAAVARRRNGNGNGEEEGAEPIVEADEAVEEVTLTDERFAELEAAEELLLTVTDQGFGKRCSAYEYRVSGRGGQGIANITLTPRTGAAVAATFPVRPGDDVMLVTDAGRLIRTPADQVRLTGRSAMGVTLLRLNAGERVTSVFPVLDDADAAPPEAPGETAGEDEDA